MLNIQKHLARSLKYHKAEATIISGSTQRVEEIDELAQEKTASSFPTLN